MPDEITTTETDWLTQTFRRNKSLYGGFVMELEDETPPEATTESADGAGGDEVDPSATEGENAPESGETESEEESSTLSHDDALSALAGTRKEAASWRTKFRDLEKKMADAKTPEEVAAAIAETQAASESEARTLLAENVALKAGLPNELASRLQGTTREELEADAKALAKLVPAPEASDDPDLNGGLDGSSGTPVFDVDAARKAARAARSRGY